MARPHASKPVSYSHTKAFFLRDILDEIWDLIESVSDGFPTYSFNCHSLGENQFMWEPW